MTTRSPKAARWQSSAVALFLIAGVATPTAAATITWDPVMTQTGNPTDVSTLGAYFDSAVFWGNDVVVNGVTFNRNITGSGNVGFHNGSNITYNNVHASFHFGVVPPGYGYTELVQMGAYGPNASAHVTIGGLTVGHTYQVQLFSQFWDTQYEQQYSGDNVVFSDTALLGLNPVPGSMLLGTFVADSMTQNIHIAALSANPSDIFPNMQVRSLTEVSEVPEPSTLLLVGGGLVLSIARWRRRHSRNH